MFTVFSILRNPCSVSLDEQIDLVIVEGIEVYTYGGTKYIIAAPEFCRDYYLSYHNRLRKKTYTGEKDTSHSKSLSQGIFSHFYFSKFMISSINQANKETSKKASFNLYL